ncbi:MarR family winged helix-turn-helix transcriptional regulator [Streptomyces sirii]|uniref:MarR family winged helix-turn-helix transcriptional regulator n=1 Tax=Streptomyces sirii TaxID=3127701 RepID=UPI003D360C99
MSDEQRDALLRQHADSYRGYVTATVLHGQAAADALGQHPTDLYALHALDLAGPLTTGALAERIGLSQSATTRLVDRLVRAGRARRTTDPEDRRRVLVEPLPLPPEEDEAAFGPARRRMAEVFGAFSEDELRVLFRYFAAAAPALRDATAETKGLPAPGAGDGPATAQGRRRRR